MNNAGLESPTTLTSQGLDSGVPSVEMAAGGTDQTPSVLQRPDIAAWNPEQQLDPSEYAVLQIFEALVRLGRGEIDVNTLLVGKPEGVQYKADVGNAENELSLAYTYHRAPMSNKRRTAGEVTLKVIFVPDLSAEFREAQLQALGWEKFQEMYPTFGTYDYKFYANPDRMDYLGKISLIANSHSASLAGTEKIWPALFDDIQFPIRVRDRKGFMYANPAYKSTFQDDVQ